GLDLGSPGRDQRELGTHEERVQGEEHERYDDRSEIAHDCTSSTLSRSTPGTGGVRTRRSTRRPSIRSTTTSITWFSCWPWSSRVDTSISTRSPWLGSRPSVLTTSPATVS